MVYCAPSIVSPYQFVVVAEKTLQFSRQLRGFAGNQGVVMYFCIQIGWFNGGGVFPWIVQRGGRADVLRAVEKP